MELADYLKIVSSLLTALSVFFAIYVYRRNEDRRTFASFRDSLSKLRNDITRLDNLLSEPEFNVLGTNIASRLRQLKPDEWSRDDFIAYLTDEGNHNQIASAIHLGRLESDCIDKSRELLSSIKITPYAYKEQLPVLSMLLAKLLFYIDRVGSTVMSPMVFNSAIGNPKAIKDVLVPEIEKYEHDEQMFAEIAVFSAVFAAAALQMDKWGQKLFDATEQLLIIVTETIARKSDAELRKSSKQQRRLAGELAKINNEHAIEDAFDCFKAIKAEFTDDDWNRIVEAKTKIFEYVKDDED